MKQSPTLRNPVIVVALIIASAAAVILPIVASASAPTFIEYPIPTSLSQSPEIISGPDGNLWIAEGNGNKIAKANPGTGTMIEYSLPAGPPFTYSQGPNAITTGPDGNLWFTDGFTEKVSKITPLGALTEYTLPFGYLLPDSITAGPDNNLWFTAFSSNQIGVMNASGVLVNQYTVSGNPEGISVGPDGNIWFAEQTSDSIGKINIATGTINTYNIPFSPFDTTPGPDGNVWFDGGANVGKINPSSGTFTEYNLTPGSNAINIVAGPDGNMWFTLRYTGLGMINPGNGAITQYATPTASGGGPQDLTAGPDKNIWYVDDNNTNVIGRACLNLAGSTCSSSNTGTTGVGSSSTSSSGSTGSGSSSTGSMTPPTSSGSTSTASTSTSGGTGSTKTESNSSVASRSATSDKVTVVVQHDGSTVATVQAGIDLSNKDYTVPTGQTLYVDGSLGIVDVRNAGSIKGTGLVKSLVVDQGATLSPGHSPGCLTSGDLVIDGTYQAQIGGTSPCSGYDQVVAKGTITLSGLLQVQLNNSFTPQPGQQYTIIKNEGTSAVKGTFSGLREGSLLIAQNTPFIITYKGGDGNDVVLRVAQKDSGLLASSNGGRHSAPKSKNGLFNQYKYGLISAGAITMLLTGMIVVIGRMRKKRGSDTPPPNPASLTTAAVSPSVAAPPPVEDDTHSTTTGS